MHGATAVTVKFTNTVAMEQGDHAQVVLAGFRGATDTDLNQPTTQRLDLANGLEHTGFDPTTSSWDEASTLLKLVLQVANDGGIAASTPQTVVAPSQVGILLPLGALTANQAALTLAFAGVDDPPDFGAAAVEVSPAAAAQTLPDSSLQYSAADPASDTAVTLTLQNRVQQQAGDYYEVKLAGFQGATIGSMTEPQLGRELEVHSRTVLVDAAGQPGAAAAGQH